jgi:hypothetical protein
MNNIISQSIINKLRTKNYDPIENGAYIVIYQDEFDIDTWESYCEVLNVDVNSDSVELLIVATKEQNWSTNNGD